MDALEVEVKDAVTCDVTWGLVNRNAITSR